MRIKLLLLPVLSFVTAIVAFEIVARVSMTPDDAGTGRLWGVLLPPWRVVPSESFAQDPKKPVPRVTVDGTVMTQGDLWGIYREDPVLGYTYQERARSVNGWWRSNNLGARSDEDMADEKAVGRRRVLVFGESFGHGSRMPQGRAWSTLLAERDAGLEIGNFSVDGYSTAQAYLRYRVVRARVKYDTVLFMFVPGADLWRDVNTIRSLAAPWYSYTVAPRCLFDEGQWECVSGPYSRGSDTYRLDGVRMTDKLRSHLRKYDRFYFPSVYEDIPVVGSLVTARLVAAKLASRARDRLLEENMKIARLDTEAVAVTEKILQSVVEAAKEDGAEAKIVFLADEHFLAGAARDPLYRARWASLVGRYEGAGIPVVDFLPEQLARVAEMDRSPDGTHFGARGNRVIAELVYQSLSGTLLGARQ